MHSISHDRAEETPAAKARWFQSLTIEERMQHFVEMSDMLLALKPELVQKKDAQPVPGRIRVLTLE
ncbi:MAG: hypothetical protein FJW32_25555 [Acidobacteria bacterium]|nr:hypothetical protein [Acidobacteriota bacterium]